MSKMFVRGGKDLVPIRLEGDELAEALEEGWVQQSDELGLDTIYILPKMNYGQKQYLTGLASKMQMSQEQMRAMQKKAQQGKPGAEGQQDADDEGSGMSAGFDLGAYQNELAVLNIKSWTGPSFVGVPCTRENILDMDPDNPLLQKALEEIARRARKQQKQQQTDPKLNPK